MIGAEQFFIDDGRPVSPTRRFVRALRVFGVCAGLVVAAVFATRRALYVRTWPATPCRIVASDLNSTGTGRTREHPYRAGISFEYVIDGVDHVVDNASQNDGGTDDAAEADAMVRRFPVGTETVCYVDPRDPSRAMLERPSPRLAELFLAGALLVTVLAAWFYCVPQLRRIIAAPPTAPQHQRSKQRAGMVAAVGLVAGFGSFTVAEYVLPLARNAQATTWQLTPCEILESNIISSTVHGEASVTTYRTDILYRYHVAGVSYRSNRFSLTEGGTMSGDSRERFVKDQYPAGTETTCYVNPADPADAVLSRRVSPTVAFGAWPFALTLLGAAVLATTGRDKRANELFARNKWTLCALGLLAVGLGVWAVFAPP
jgi:hypothetical protein